jgi:hypothetical protein
LRLCWSSTFVFGRVLHLLLKILCCFFSKVLNDWRLVRHASFSRIVVVCHA